MKEQDPAVQGVGASVTHATPLKWDAAYDHRARQAALDIEVHHADGRSTHSMLVLTPGQVDLYAVQFQQLVAKREEARRAGR